MLEAKDIDLNLLVVFQEVFQERQISAVAKKLKLSQPAVSNALARLRKNFNDELFVRTAQGMQPTPFALQIAEPIALALSNINSALNQHETFNPATSKRQFSIAMTDVGEVYFMPELIERCHRLAPNIRLNSVRAHLSDLKTEMETGRVDLAIGAFDSMSQALYQRRLFKQKYVCMFRQGHPCAKIPLNLTVFLQAQHLMVTSMESPYDKINQVLEKSGAFANSHFRVSHFGAVPYIISSSDLLVTVPQKLAESAALPFKLDYCPSPLELPDLQTNIFWHRRFNLDQGNQWLRNVIADHCAEI